MILMKDIVREGNKVLREKAKDVKIPLSKTDQKTLIEMLKFLINSQDEEMASKYQLRAGVGLAAPQINISKKMLCIVTYDFEGIFHVLPLVNPILLNHSQEMIYLPDGEGCLSVDRETHGLTPRYKSVTVKSLFFNIKTNVLEEKIFNFDGYLSIVFQHEYDHLNGILFVDKLYDELNDCTPLTNPHIEE